MINCSENLPLTVHKVESISFLMIFSPRIKSDKRKVSANSRVTFGMDWLVQTKIIFYEKISANVFYFSLGIFDVEFFESKKSKALNRFLDIIPSQLFCN